MSDATTEKPLLFSPMTVRGVTLPNRIVISPMCQYSAREGLANEWHTVHLGQFALGGAGLVFCEAAAVEKRGRITHGDVGLWNDEQIAPHAQVGAGPPAFARRSGIEGTRRRFGVTSSPVCPSPRVSPCSSTPSW